MKKILLMLLLATACYSLDTIIVDTDDMTPLSQGSKLRYDVTLSYDTISFGAQFERPKNKTIGFHRGRDSIYMEILEGYPQSPHMKRSGYSSIIKVVDGIRKDSIYRMSSDHSYYTHFLCLYEKDVAMRGIAYTRKGEISTVAPIYDGYPDTSKRPEYKDLFWAGDIKLEEEFAPCTAFIASDYWIPNNTKVRLVKGTWINKTTVSSKAYEPREQGQNIDLTINLSGRMYEKFPRHNLANGILFNVEGTRCKNTIQFIGRNRVVEIQDRRR